MPSGYTADLYEGTPQTFRQFALRCSRAMGATVLLRDEPPSVTPTVDNINGGGTTYAQQRLLEAQERLADLRGMSVAAAIEAEEVERQGQERYRDEYVAKRDVLRVRYQEMLAHVNAWRPPTEDHEGLKELMAAQLNESIRFDCDGYVPPVRARLTPGSWLDARIAEAEADVAHNATYLAEEKERNSGRAAWVRALYASLPPEDEA